MLIAIEQYNMQTERDAALAERDALAVRLDGVEAEAARLREEVQRLRGEADVPTYEINGKSVTIAKRGEKWEWMLGEHGYASEGGAYTAAEKFFSDIRWEATCAERQRIRRAVDNQQSAEALSSPLSFRPRRV